MTQNLDPGSSAPLAEFVAPQLGPCTVPSPLPLGEGFVPDDIRVPLNGEIRHGQPADPSRSFERAGPRRLIYFQPQQVRAAAVTCGGLCPGLNNVVRSLVLQLHYGYGVAECLGIRYGYRGLDPTLGLTPLRLTPQLVSDIHEQGGSILGVARGNPEPSVMVRQLRDWGVNVLFVIGGDGTQQGAHQIWLEANRQAYPLAVVGIPKTIDNDIPYVWRSFGYATAVEKARQVIDSAHNEARSHFHGVGLVKLMGRDAGFIAAGATLASQEVNFTLVPEVPFRLHGEGGFLEALLKRLEQRRHAVIVVAEGAGRDLFPTSQDPRHRPDIGLFLLQEIRAFFRQKQVPVDVKYFDPSYYIRGAAANTEDAFLCDQFARNAVHAAMAGKTGIVLGIWYNLMTHVPVSLCTSKKKRMAESSELWQSVLKATGQPVRFGC
ncbi:MAG: ATP-dependent 6-phosphofructokinase [Bryobacteraceae bacterium]|nr:ATP-dependent 6-phosphofructokinase [Bryobacteraceae bacterium]MDW8378128.1 ATP-dependent 6-phosphofructokinase [Bryobacterales bacterium]